MEHSKPLEKVGDYYSSKANELGIPRNVYRDLTMTTRYGRGK